MQVGQSGPFGSDAYISYASAYLPGAAGHTATIYPKRNNSAGRGGGAAASNSSFSFTTRLFYTRDAGRCATPPASAGACSCSWHPRRRHACLPAFIATTRCAAPARCPRCLRAQVLGEYV